MNLQQHVAEWITRISVPESALNGMAVCPFARSVKYSIVEIDLDAMTVPDNHCEMIIYALPDTVTEQQMTDRCYDLNQQFMAWTFLPDHKDKRTYLKGVLTNNCGYNLVLCQPTEKIVQGRQTLLKTKYYEMFDQEYLQDQCNYNAVVTTDHWTKTQEAVR